MSLKWTYVPFGLALAIALVLCGGALLDALGIVDIYATPGQLLVHAASGQAPVGSDGETPYYAIDEEGSVLTGADGLPATTNSADGAVEGVWKGGLAKSNHTHDGVHTEDDDPNTFYSPLRSASISIDKSKMWFLKASQFEWGSGAYDGGTRVFQWASTPEDYDGTKLAEDLREAGDITDLYWRRAGSGQTEGMDEETAKKNEENAKQHRETAIVFSGSLEVGVERTFGTDSGEDGSYVVRVRYPGAAILANEDQADLVLTYRRISLCANAPFNEGGQGSALLGIIRARNLIGEGRYGTVDEAAENSTDGDHWVWYVGNGSVAAHQENEKNPDNNSPRKIAIGICLVCELAVVQPGGDPDIAADRIKGTVRFGVSDLDDVSGLAFAGDGLEEQFGDVSAAAAIDTYTESLLVLSGAKSYALVPDGNFLNFVGQGTNGTADGVRFVSTDLDGNTFDSGFAVLADTEGFLFEWTGRGGTTNTSTTYRFS